MQDNSDPDATESRAIESLIEQCGQNGSGYCSMAGSEYCDWECPFTNELRG